MSMPASDLQPPCGGGFLLEPAGSRPVTTPETLDDTQRALRRSVDKFARERVLPSIAGIERKEPGLMRRLLREAGELGFLGAESPEAYGGSGLDAVSSLLVTEAMSRAGSWSVTWGVHSGVGTLPIAWFGTEEQKRRWLPGMASGALVAAYALSESGSASDALAARTKAQRSADGKHWILDGSKQWITNAGFADVFVVFAQADGDKFTAFVVERDTPGFTVGKEENKMGLRGSSTCPLSFEGARIPIDNVLGEIGKGHRIAFNVLNIGRVKLGGGCIGGARNVVQLAVEYARERTAFGKPIAQYGLIREKLARMVSLIYTGEAMSHRAAGLIEARAAAAGAAPGSGEQASAMVAAAEEYAPEASILKVWGTEALGVVVDEALQIHGGYGFVEEYAVERLYRDARVNRIFEGTNEINRMLVPGTLLRRAMKGQFPFLELSQTVARALEAGQPPLPTAGPLARERRMAEASKCMAALTLQAAVESLGTEIADRQEVLGALADVLIEAYAADSAVARGLQAPGPLAEAAVGLQAIESHERAQAAARRALRAILADPTACRAALGKLQALSVDEPADVVAMRERLVEATLETGRYPFYRE